MPGFKYLLRNRQPDLKQWCDMGDSVAASTSVSLIVPTASAVSISANDDRCYLAIFNPGPNIVYMAFGGSAAVQGLFGIPPLTLYEFTEAKGNLYTGPISLRADAGGPDQVIGYWQPRHAPGQRVEIS